MKKSFLLTILCISLAICAFVVPITVNAATEGMYTYTVSDGKATVKDVNTSISGDITIPDTLGGYPVTKIDYYAFNYCSNLTSITFSSNITSIGQETFKGCYNLKNIIANNDNEYYASIDGILFNKQLTKLVKYPAGRRNTEYSIPETIVYIAGYAFQNCSNLTHITIPQGVKSINYYTFHGCSSLVDVNIPNSVTSILSGAFQGCSNLININIPDSVDHIGDYAFKGCSKLSNIILPNNLKTIRELTFYNCSSLTSITIPYSVTSIEHNAFHGCSSLMDIYYMGSKVNWNNIFIDFNNEALSLAKINCAIESPAIEITDVVSTSNSLKYISEVYPKTEVSTFGTTFIPLWLFETGSTNIATVQYDNSKYNIQDGQTFGATLSGIPDVAKDMQIVGKSFIKDTDGNYTWSTAKSASLNDTTLNELK